MNVNKGLQKVEQKNQNYVIIIVQKLIKNKLEVFMKKNLFSMLVEIMLAEPQVEVMLVEAQVEAVTLQSMQLETLF